MSSSRTTFTSADLLISVAITLVVVISFARAQRVVRDAPDFLAPTINADNYLEVGEALSSSYDAGTSPSIKNLPPPNPWGGYGFSTNYSKRIRESSKGAGLFLLAQPDVVVPFDGSNGMRLILANHTKELVQFDSSDAQLKIIQEAKDTDGIWKPIEFLQPSYCSHSSCDSYLPPQQYWEFAAPRYKGSIPTKLRFALSLDRRCKIYSNEFEGSVNREQFVSSEWLALIGPGDIDGQDRSLFTKIMNHLFKPRSPEPPPPVYSPIEKSLEADPLPPPE